MFGLKRVVALFGVVNSGEGLLMMPSTITNKDFNTDWSKLDEDSQKELKAALKECVPEFQKNFKKGCGHDFGCGKNTKKGCAMTTDDMVKLYGMDPGRFSFFVSFECNKPPVDLSKFESSVEYKITAHLGSCFCEKAPHYKDDQDCKDIIDADDKNKNKKSL